MEYLVQKISSKTFGTGKKKKTKIFNIKNKLFFFFLRLGTRPISAYIDYFDNNDNQNNFIWRKYETNEKKYRSMFLNMERIKLTYSMIVK